MKTLVVYYSRTNNTRVVADKIIEEISADREEIKEPQNRNGIIEYLKSGYQASRKKISIIEKPNLDPSDYDLIIIGTPIWAGKMSVPVRTYLNQFKDKIKDIAIFCTYGGSGFDSTIEDIALFTGKVPKSSLGIRDKQIKSGEYHKLIEEFSKSLKN